MGPETRRGLQRGRACFETRPQFKPGAGSWALLSMRKILMALGKAPHPEEPAQRASRRMHWADPADCAGRTVALVARSLWNASRVRALGRQSLADVKA